jgi:nuclear pore complex protein Nup62
VSQSPLTLSALKTPATTGTTGLGLAKTEKPAETPSFKIPTVPPSKDTKAATTTAADTTKTAAPTSSFSFGAKPGDSSKDSTAKPNEKQAVPSTEILSNLKGKTLGDILNDWQTELHDSVALFHRKAAEVAEADMKVLENADKIYKLATEAKKMSSVQENMSSTLDYIESQQAHLDKELDVFEDKLRAALSQNDSRIKLAIPGGVSAQEEREKTYQLAESLVREVETLQQDVDDLVKQANNIWNPSKDGKESSVSLYMLVSYFRLSWLTKC